MIDYIIEILSLIFIGFVIRIIIMCIILQLIKLKTITGPPILGVIGFFQYYYFQDNYIDMGITPSLMFGFFLMEILLFISYRIRDIRIKKEIKNKEETKINKEKKA